jgi:hypothetical protein
MEEGDGQSQIIIRFDRAVQYKQDDNQNKPYHLGQGRTSRNDGQGTEGLVRLLFTQLLPALTSIPPTGCGLARLTYWNVSNGWI